MIENELALSTKSASTKLTIKTKEDLLQAVELLDLVSKKRKSAEEQKKLIAAAQESAKKQAIAPWKTIIENYDLAIADLKARILDYNEEHKKTEKKIASAYMRALIDGKTMDGDVLIDSDSIAPSNIVEFSRWRFEIEDKSIIPDEFMTVDEAKIRLWVNANKGETKIPGVRVYLEKSIRLKETK